jgi:hypothetical protein
MYISVALSFSNKKKIKKEKTVMKKPSTSQLLNVGVTVITLLGMFLSSKAHDKEMSELKDDIKSELKEEKEQ